MLHAPAGGALELRRESSGVSIRGRFPYLAPTELAPQRHEQFAAGAFGTRLADSGAEVHLLVGHDFDRPLASRRAGTLEVREGPDALTFEARITPAIAETTHGRDALALIAEGLAVGLSPGFRVPRGGEVIERRGDGAVLRTVREAELHELSIVTRPAYATAQVEARSWALSAAPRRHHHAQRWRA